MRKSKKAKLTLLFLMILLMIFGVTADAGFRRMSNGRYRYYVTDRPAAPSVGRFAFIILY